MLQGINILGFFKTKAESRFENADIREFIVTYTSNIVPCFILLVPSVEVAATLKVFSIDNVEVFSDNIVVTDAGILKLLMFAGNTIQDFNDDHYYIEITIGLIKYYSEVYCVAADVSDLIGFDIVSSDVVMNGTYTLPFLSINPVFYLSYNGIAIENNVVEEGVEKYYGDIPVFSAVNIVRKAEINGTNQIFRFLSFLRALSVNGTITITCQGYSNLIYDPITESKDDSAFGDSIILSFSYREYNFIASKNEI